MSVSERLGRLLFIVPYVAARDGVPVKELAHKLGVRPRKIKDDIALLSMVGQPPLTPDHLIDLYIEDDVVYVDLHQSLSRPLRLTHDEAAGLVVGAKLAGKLAGLGADLDEVLDKLLALVPPGERALLRSLSDRIIAGTGDTMLAGPAAQLRAAAEESALVEVSYYSASSDRHKTYRLKPLAVIVHGGVDYLVALDTDQDDREKLFRLDRMGSMRPTGDSFEAPADVDLERFRTRTLYFGSEGFTAQVRFVPRRARQVRERFAGEDVVEHADGGLTVSVPTSSPAWLARWALAYGEDAEVVEPVGPREHIRQLCEEALRAYAEPPELPEASDHATGRPAPE